MRFSRQSVGYDITVANEEAYDLLVSFIYKGKCLVKYHLLQSLLPPSHVLQGITECFLGNNMGHIINACHSDV